MLLHTPNKCHKKSYCNEAGKNLYLKGRGGGKGLPPFSALSGKTGGGLEAERRRWERREPGGKEARREGWSRGGPPYPNTLWRCSATEITQNK